MITVTNCFSVGTASQYEWRCSQYDSTKDRYYLPNFGGRANVLASTLINSQTGASYVYPVSQINCTGTVTDVEFCYTTTSSNVNNNLELLVFSLLTLNQNMDSFTVTKSIAVSSTPNLNECSKG